MCGSDEGDVCIFTGTGTTHATNLLIDKLRVKEIAEQVTRAKATQEKQENGQVLPMGKEEVEKQIEQINFCE